jgi:hypothetical protein
VGGGEAARHDARNRAPLQTAAALAVNLARQTNRKGGQWAAATQQPHTLLVTVAPWLQRRQFKKTRLLLDCQLRWRLQVMRARGLTSEDGASGCRVQHKTHDVELQNKTNEESWCCGGVALDDKRGEACLRFKVRAASSCTFVI